MAVPVGTLGTMLNIDPDRWVWGEVLREGAASTPRLSNYLMRDPQVPLACCLACAAGRRTAR